MGDTCGDNRFELIEKYKQKLLDATNIEDSPEEMAVIDNILFRFWQMGWLDKDTNVANNDCISRQAAIDSLGEEPPIWYDGEEFLAERSQWRRDVNAIKAVPSIQSDVSGTIQNAINASTGNNDYMIGLRNGMRWCLSVLDGNEPEFEECSSAQSSVYKTETVEDCISRAAVVDTIEGVDWYHQNDSGEMVHGANSAEHQAWYKAEDIYKAIEGVPPAQRWIPWDSGKFPEESGTYTVTAYDGATKRVTYAKYQKRLKRWELTGARAYWRVLAWMPLPTPYREGGQDGKN